jgi:hypothetical protein
VFRESVMTPNKTYQSVLFYPIPDPEQRMNQLFTALTLQRQRGPRIRIGVTDIETQDRLVFSPFSVSFPQNTRRR